MKKNFSIIFVVFIIIAFLIINVSCSNSPQKVENTPTLTPQPTNTNTPSPSPTITPTVTPTQIGGFSGSYIMYGIAGENEVWSLYHANGNIINTFYTHPLSEMTVKYSEIKWSPTGDRIAILFWNDGGTLILFRPDGTEIFSKKTNIHFYGGVVGQINWSPDGQWLVFPMEGDNSNIDIYKIDKNGENLQQLSDNYNVDSQPYFLPKGEKIMFMTDPLGGQIINSDGSDLHIADFALLWTKDENYYLVLEKNSKRLVLVNTTTNERSTIFTATGEDYYINVGAFFSPDEEWLYFSQYQGMGTPYEWYRINMKNLGAPIFFKETCMDKNYLPYERIAECRPIFSPDKTMIIYEGYSSDTRYKISDRYFSIDPITLKESPFGVNPEGVLYGFWQPNID